MCLLSMKHNYNSGHCCNFYYFVFFIITDSKVMTLKKTRESAYLLQPDHECGSDSK